MRGGRRPWVTIVLLALIVLVWAIMTVQGGSLSATEDTELLKAWGAAIRPDMLLGGQYWRLFTANFLHIGLLHLAVNGYSLWVVGAAIEALYGRWRLVYLFVVAGVLSMTVSLVLGPPMILSAGASGALFGLLGAIVWYRFSSPLSFRVLWRPLVITLLLNLALGLALYRYVDNWAHLGGLVGGFVAAAVVGVPIEPGWAMPRFFLGRRIHRILAGVVLAGVIGLTFGLVELPGASQDLARALRAADEGRWAEAEAGLLQAKQREPDEPEIRYQLLQVYAWEGKCDGAQAEYAALTQQAGDQGLGGEDLSLLRPLLARACPKQ